MFLINLFVPNENYYTTTIMDPECPSKAFVLKPLLPGFGLPEIMD